VLNNQRRMGLTDILQSKEGQIGVSIILGFGLATMFRKVCNDAACVVVKGPKMSEIQGQVYRVDDTCYRYKPNVVQCKDTDLVQSG
jgi:hypothetical protein